MVVSLVRATGRYTKKKPYCAPIHLQKAILAHPFVSVILQDALGCKLFNQGMDQGVIGGCTAGLMVFC